MNSAQSAPPPPSASEFFNSPDLQEKVVVWIEASKGAPRATAEAEVKKFVSYWTEPNKSGTKVRWEGEKFFDIRRRLGTWFGNAGKFAAKSGANQKSTIGLAI